MCPVRGMWRARLLGAVRENWPLLGGGVKKILLGAKAVARPLCPASAPKLIE